jgi:hypothetical protein
MPLASPWSLASTKWQFVNKVGLEAVGYVIWVNVLVKAVRRIEIVGDLRATGIEFDCDFERVAAWMSRPAKVVVVVQVAAS